MAPLNDLAAECGTRKGLKSKSKWHWDRQHQQAFDDCKKMMTDQVKLAFPNFSKPFHLYSDSLDLQLGATLVQSNRPLGFYTRKLNSA